ncbi:MAG: hypothetical protein GY874_10580 [Desulfobacteraceae bacterium]|nr:hypothetical protein [Desulfobacteraceae bacterium]
MQRANWLNTDMNPDGEMPFIIDYIDSNLGQDNAIKSAYKGGGYYSAYIIDCDGTIIKSLNWGWMGPGGDFMGLPLTPIEELYSFLDDYLANAPDCYDNAQVDDPQDEQTPGDSTLPPNEEPSVEFTCKDPRPEFCTQEYDPVCGMTQKNQQKTYPNGCEACSDITVIGWRKRACHLAY